MENHNLFNATKETGGDFFADLCGLLVLYYYYFFFSFSFSFVSLFLSSLRFFLLCSMILLSSIRLGIGDIKDHHIHPIDCLSFLPPSVFIIFFFLSDLAIVL